MGILDQVFGIFSNGEDDYGDLSDDFVDEEDDEDDDSFEEDELNEKPKKAFFKKFNKTNKDAEEDDYDDLIPEKPLRAERSSAKITAEKESKESARQEKSTRTHQSSKITPMRSNRRNSQSQSMEICVVKPTSMEDTRQIVDALVVDNSIVILNLEGLDMDLAQRIYDFSSGANYSIRGNSRKISSYIFVFAPHNVAINGDLENILGSSIPSVRAGY